MTGRKPGPRRAFVESLPLLALPPIALAAIGVPSFRAAADFFGSSSPSYAMGAGAVGVVVWLTIASLLVWQLVAVWRIPRRTRPEVELATSSYSRFSWGWQFSSAASSITEQTSDRCAVATSGRPRSWLVEVVDFDRYCLVVLFGGSAGMAAGEVIRRSVPAGIPLTVAIRQRVASVSRR